MEMEESSDRISELPDEALHHIISWLGPKRAVQTSILSKRWQNLWSSLPSLRFSHTPFTGVDFSIGMARFEQFVTDFLSHRDNNSAVREFKLSTAQSETASGFIENCISFVIHHEIERLHIEAVCPSTPFNFPDGFSTCRTLRVLRLKQSYRYANESGSVVVPKPFVLPTLKTLYLERFRFDDNLYSFPKEPFSGFLDLEELTLCSCDVSDLTISAQKLKFLDISFCEMDISTEKKMESISAPMLTSFRHKGPVMLICPKIELPRLEEVYFGVYVYNPGYQLHSDYVENKMPENVVTMLEQLGNARIVTLTVDTIQLLAEFRGVDPYLVEKSLSSNPDIKCLNITRDPEDHQMMWAVWRTVMNYFPEWINEEQRMFF